MRRIMQAGLCLVLAASQMLIAPLAYGQQLPALGDGADMSSSAERRLGDRIVREIYRDPDYVDDPVLMDYVGAIWQRLMAAARARGELTPELDERYAWEVLLDRDRSVNAFALPGGYMGVNLGLIAVVNSEDELASVLGHELSHITQRHISRLMQQQASQGPWVMAAMILGALAASRNPQAAGAVIAGGQAAAIQGQLNFSRDMEREADRVGYGVMTQAGFEPQGFVTMFEKLQQANRFNDTGAFPYLRSHPLTTERIADMQARQQLLPRADARPLSMSHAMLSARARVLSNARVESLRAALAEGTAAQPQGRAAAQQAGILYAAALAASNLHEHVQAAALFAKLQSVVRADAKAAQQVRLLGAELALATGDARLARERLAAQAPDLSYRPVLFLWSQAMTQSAQPYQVSQQLQTWLATRPNDAQAWQLLSAAYAAQGQPVRALRAEAESYVARMDYAAAENRFKAAQDLLLKSASPDHFEASIIDTRSRQMRLLLREQALER